MRFTGNSVSRQAHIVYISGIKSFSLHRGFLAHKYHAMFLVLSFKSIDNIIKIEHKYFQRSVQ